MLRKKIIVTIFIVTAFSFALVFFVSRNNPINATERTSGIFTDKETASDLEVVSFITPHHLVADKLIDEIFSEVSKKSSGKKIDRIILLSPDHFNKKSGWSFVSDQDWIIGNEKIMVDQRVAREISEIGFVSKSNELFAEEHGITALLPYFKKYFPKTKIVPIILKNELPKEKAEQIVELIDKLNGNSLVVLSSDFSHYLDKSISAFHDKKAIETISNLSFADVYNLETDCVSGLYILMRYSQLKGAEKFQLAENSNSSEIYGRYFIGENTSYVTGYFTKAAREKVGETANILFLGDLMLDRYERQLIEKKGFSWMTKKTERLFQGQDLNVANLEGPVTSNPSVSVGTEVADRNHLKFTFDPDSTRNFLQQNRINVVNIGNNHILNFGGGGLEQTKNNLQNYGVEYFGDPLDADNFLVKGINGRKIALVNYNQFSKINAEEVVGKIKAAKKQSDFVAVYAHWGAEYQLTENKSQEEKAHAFIEAGADLVIGSHPHVVQPLEIYQGKIIFYSLGNFIFDQYFSEDTKTMLAVGVSISDNKMDAVLTPLYQGQAGQLELADEQKRSALLERLASGSKTDYNIKQGIKSGHLQITQISQLGIKNYDNTRN